MSDLIERLRNLVGMKMSIEVSELSVLTEAADALERARADYKRLDLKYQSDNQAQRITLDWQQRRIEQLEAFVISSSCGERDCCGIPNHAATQWCCSQCVRKEKVLQPAENTTP